MKFKIDNLKRKTSLFMRGFLVAIFCLTIFAFGALFYIIYLSSNDNFLSLTPSQTIFYWHSNEGEKEEVKNLLFTAICEFFPSLNFSSLNEIVLHAKEVSFALLSRDEAILFLTTETNEDLKNELEEKNLNYILEEKRITIANSKNALFKAISVRKKTVAPLGNKFNIRLNLNFLSTKYHSQIYFNSSAMQLFEEKIFSLWPQIGEIIIIPNSKYQDMTDSLWKKYTFIFSSTTIDAKKLEDFIKEKLALQLPISQEKILPDKTIVKELIADPTVFHFQKMPFQNSEINYISEPKLNFEFAYIQDTIFFASNSKEFLQSYLEMQKKTKNIAKKIWENLFKDKQFKYLGINLVDKLGTTY